MRGFSPLEAGLSTIPLAFVSFLVAPRAGEMVGRIGTKRPIMLCGISMLAVSFLQLFVTKTTPMIILFVIYIFLGIGFGMLNSPITITAIESLLLVRLLEHLLQTYGFYLDVAPLRLSF